MQETKGSLVVGAFGVLLCSFLPIICLAFNWAYLPSLSDVCICESTGMSNARDNPIHEETLVNLIQRAQATGDPSTEFSHRTTWQSFPAGFTKLHATF